MSSFNLAQIAEALSVSKRATEMRAGREAWLYAEESVRGGKRRIYAITDLPVDVREALQRQALSTAMITVATPTPACAIPHPAAVREVDLTDRQRLERDARAGVLAAIKRFQGVASCSQTAAMAALLAWAASGQADDMIMRMLQLARDPRGRAGNGLPSVRTLKRWLSSEKRGVTALAPRTRQSDMTPPEWARDFLAIYQQPQKLSVDQAYRIFSEGRRNCPSIHQVRRFLDKLGTVTREAGRMGARELKNIQPFIRRDVSELEPNDVWTGDGHTFDAEVQHPLHGRPFRPEITAFLDVRTRRLVAWSIGLAESSWAVADALRWGVERNGVPALIYVDNGSGYRNAMMGDEATGLIGRIGSTLTHSIPYNSQARGVIERFWGSTLVPAAKELPSYMGAAMDREARLEQFKLTRKALKHGGAMPLIPWDVFAKFLQDKFDAYNARAHRSLGNTSPDLVWSAFAAKGWTQERLAPEQLATLFRPRVSRTVARGELQVMNNRYFARDLTEFHGAEVHVAYDIHDASKVWVYAQDGRLICEAECDGNKRNYFPVPVVEQARQKRAQGRLNRVDVKRDEILAELHGAPALTVKPAETIVIAGKVISPAEAIAARTVVTSEPEVTTAPAGIPRIQPTPQRKSRSEMSSAEIYQEWQEIGRRLQAEEPVSEQDRNFYRRWPESSQGKVWLKRHANGA